MDIFLLKFPLKMGEVKFLLQVGISTLALKKPDWISQWISAILFPMLPAANLFHPIFQTLQLSRMLSLLMSIGVNFFVQRHFLSSLVSYGFRHISASFINLGKTFKSFSLFCIFLICDQVF
jgi:hypothetical protein